MYGRMRRRSRGGGGRRRRRKGRRSRRRRRRRRRGRRRRRRSRGRRRRRENRQELIQKIKLFLSCLHSWQWTNYFVSRTNECAILGTQVNGSAAINGAMHKTNLNFDEVCRTRAQQQSLHPVHKVIINTV